MSAQAGVVSSSQVTVPPGPSGNSQGKAFGEPSTWAWAWFVASLLFLITSYMGRRGRGE
jgi:hypothetical protein